MENRSAPGRGWPAPGGLALALAAALVAVSGCRTAEPAPEDSPRACGSYRWRVKTLSDAEAARVEAEPVETTIHELVHLQRPHHQPHGQRRSPELQTYRVQGRLLAVQDRRDHDLHLLLADPEYPKSRLIAEIPDPPCSMGSAHEKEFAAARQAARSLRHQAGSPELVEVTGVAFFDFAHIQRGRAHNGVELHPVLSVTEVPLDEHTSTTLP